jgi:hypothetical protein
MSRSELLASPGRPKRHSFAEEAADRFVEELQASRRRKGRLWRERPRLSIAETIARKQQQETEHLLRMIHHNQREYELARMKETA